MSQMKQKDYPIKWIALNRLSVVWLDAQRPLNLREARRIADNFDPDAMDPLTVTVADGNGIHHIIDGQTRHAAVRLLWDDDSQRVPCRVLDTKSRQEAANIWLTMNRGHKTPKAIETFLIAETAGRPDEVAIGQIVREMGFRIGLDSREGFIAAVGALLTVFRRHGEFGLRWALSTIEDTWGRDRDAYQGGIIQAYAELLGKHESVIDRKRLVKVVEKQYTPGRLLGKAKAVREAYKGTLPANVVTILEATYNQNLRTGARLEDA